MPPLQRKSAILRLDENKTRIKKARLNFDQRRKEEATHTEAKIQTRKEEEIRRKEQANNQRLDVEKGDKERLANTRARRQSRLDEEKRKKDWAFKAWDFKYKLCVDI